ncbi:hypothetical protein J7E97_21820 [Streptomyces sp. ISL-66]|uniref:hypothetical protein n=1 Tax=Streptomyces sp. ISL-66 TaxID=2819186 RepID=UPI001BEBA6F1|nr:hypothetical protein [Streptomyces sp. ISL-66]MBT2470439.1 hypothetical protein [Streptomyces sp. ISL-66]
MPKAVLDVSVRYLDQDLREEYLRSLSLSDYLYQEPPTGLPRLIERDYVKPDFFDWANLKIEEAGFDPKEIELRYASIDVRLAPIRASGRPLSFPFMINSAFTYNGLNLHGPFVAGHQAGISMVQSLSEVKYARFNLPPHLDGVFTSDHQTSVIADSIHGIKTAPGVDGLIAALPDRGRDPEMFQKSNIARVLTGGHITDAAHDREPGTTWPGNHLRGVPFKITPEVYGGRMPLYANDFTYYSFLRSDLHDELLRDARFLRLIDLIRRLGPSFKANRPNASEGLLFNPQRNMQFITELITRSAQ